MNKLVRVGLIGLAGVIFAGASDCAEWGTPDADGDSECRARSERSCFCPDGGMGIQTCYETELGYGACHDCVVTSSSSGDIGSSGSSETATSGCSFSKQAECMLLGGTMDADCTCHVSGSSGTPPTQSSSGR